MMENTGNIYQSIASIIGDLQAIPKDQESGGNRFTFAFRGIDGIKDALSPLLSKHGVCIIPEVMVEDERTVTQGDRSMNHVILTVQFTFYASDGSSLTAKTKGEGMDYGDKAYAKAHTMAFKTCLDEVFCIKTHDRLDNEYDNVEAVSVETDSEAQVQETSEDPKTSEDPMPEPPAGKKKITVQQAAEMIKERLGENLQATVNDLIGSHSEMDEGLKNVDIAVWSREDLYKLWTHAAM